MPRALWTRWKTPPYIIDADPLRAQREAFERERAEAIRDFDQLVTAQLAPLFKKAGR